MYTLTETLSLDFYSIPSSTTSRAIAWLIPTTVDATSDAHSRVFSSSLFLLLNRSHQQAIPQPILSLQTISFLSPKSPFPLLPHLGSQIRTLVSLLTSFGQHSKHAHPASSATFPPSLSSLFLQLNQGFSVHHSSAPTNILTAFLSVIR